MAIGPNAKASSVKALAIGNNVSASGTLSIAIGTASNPSTDTTTAEMPHPTSSEGTSSVAIGTSAIAQTNDSIAIGTRAATYTANTTSTPVATVGVQSIAIGFSAETRDDNAISIGTKSKANSVDAIAIGDGAEALNTNAVVIGKASTAEGSDSVTIGMSNANNGKAVITTGNSNQITNSQGAKDTVQNSGLYGSSNAISSVSSSNTSNAITDVYAVGNGNKLNQMGEKNVLTDVSIMGNQNTIENGTAGAYTQTVKQIAVVGSGNKVKGNTDINTTTWGTVQRDTILGYNNTVDATQQSTPVSNLQILGNDVTATLGNSVYLGTGSSATASKSATTEAIELAKEQGDAEAIASDEYKKATTEAEKTAIKQKYEAQYIHAANIAAMDQDGISAGITNYDKDYTYGNDSAYTYAGSQATGVVTVGSKDATRRIQNVSAGLVGPNSTDAVNGSQLYALTRQIRFGGDNSSFGDTAAGDANVVARGSNETISITGGSDAVTSSTTDGTTTYTVDAAKLTGNNIAVVANTDTNALHVQLASNLKDLNTAQLGSGSGDSYKETIKLDGTGTNGGQMTLANADGTVKTTLDTTGLTIADGPKFTSSGIDAANQQIHNVTAGKDDADAVNVKQLNSARTLLTQGKNTTLADTEADGHHTYTVNVDNLAVKANGTGTTTVELAKGINFKNGTNTTAAVGTDGTVTISATHNKLSTVSAATGDNDNVTLTSTDVDGNTVTSTGLKNTYTTVTKDGTAHTVTFARNDGTTQTLSLGDLDGASTEALNKAAAKATSEVTNGTNVTSVTKTTGNNGQNIYTVNVDDLAVKTTSGEKKSVHLKDGLVFADGTNTTATVGDNGTIKFNVSDDAIKKQAVNAINVTGGSNVTVKPETNADGTLKTFTVAASDLKYSANGTSKTTSLANGISFAAGTNTTAEIDNNGAIKINATHNKLNATGTATKATADSNAVTLTLNDQDGNTTTTALTDTYTTVSKDAANKKVTFKRNDGETQTLELSDLGGITEAQDKYVTGGKVTYEANGNGTAALTGNNGLTASITGLKDTKVTSGASPYVGTQGDASGSATLTMNDGSTATISGLKDDYITSAAVGTENNHVTMTRLGGGTVDLNLNPILEKYSLSDYHLVGAGTTHDQAYAVDNNGTVTLNIVDDKNPTGTPKTIQITGLASQSGVNAGRTTVTSSDESVKVSDSTSNSDTHTYDIKVDYSKIPANLTVQYSGDNRTTGSNTMDKATAFSGTANQIVTTAADGKVSFKLADDISGIQSVTTGDAKLNANGLTVTNGPTFTKSNIDVNNQQIHKVTAGESDTDAANVGQVKAATTEVKNGTNASLGTTTDTTDNHKIYTVNVDNLSLSQNGTKVGTGVALKDGLDFQSGTNTTASVTADGKVSFSISNDAIKAQAKDAVVLAAGDNVTIGTPTDANNVKTYTVSVNDLKLQADGADKATRKLSEGINFAGGTNTTADVTADGKVTYDLKDSISLNQVQTGESTLNINGLTITDGPKVLKSGIDAGNKQITNVASGGTVESNAATIGDLKKAIETASAGTTASGFKTKGNYGEAVTSRLDKQLNVVGDVDTTKIAKDDLSNGNVGVVTSTDMNGNATLTVKLNKDINLGENGSVRTGSTLINKTGITNGNMSLDADGLTIQNGPKFTNNGINAANQKVTGVADGTNSQDAVNVSQLEAVKSDVTTGWTIAGKNASGTDLTANIGKGKTVSYAGGKYATATLSVDSTTGNATVAVDAVTNTLSVGADGKITSNGDGLTTTGTVKDAINGAISGAYWTIQAGNATGNAQKVSAGSTIMFNADSNLSLSQDGTNFTYALNTDLQDMTSVTAKDQKDNTAVLTGEGLKVSDKDGNSLTQHATEIRLHDATKSATDTTTDVVLNKQGLQNGGHTITGVANGTVDAGSQDAINGSQLYELQQKVTNTEDQLAKAISDASTQASNSELHIRKGTYGIGKDKDGQDVADPKGKNSVSIDVVNAEGAVDGQVVINNVAKASELGTVGELADNLKNPAGGPTTVVQAVNNVNQKVDDSLKQVNGDITSAVTEAKKHTKVAHVDGDSNVIIDGAQKSDDNGTVYKLGLNKEHVDLNQVHIYGNEGRVKTKTVEAETVKIDDKTKLDKTGLTTGNTTVADGRVVVGGDNGIKIEAKGDQQTISGLSNRIWTGKAVSGRAATEDQLRQAVENATATAAQNEQHIQSGNYDVGQGKGLDGKPIGKNSVAINVVSGDGTKPGDVKGQVVINNVAKADELGNVAKLNDAVKNADGRPTSTVDAINNLDKRVETKVGDNVYSNVAGKEIADGDSATTAIGKLNNRMNDIYTTAGQHSSVSTADTNLTLSESKNASGGTDYKIGLNKEQINLGNLTIKGNEGSIEAKSIKSDSFTAGDTVVNKDGIKVGDQSALTGDSLKVNGKTYVDDKGVDANGQVIRNVGDGKDDGDAVNVKQVNDLAARQGEAIGQNAAHINQLDRAVNRLDSRINRVGAGAAALAALHPGNYDPDDKVDFAAGFGNYRGASAAAVGMYYHPDETTTMSVGASFGGGENMVNAGITWKMGKNSGHMRTQAATKAVPVQFVAAPTQTTQPTGQTEGTKTPQPVTTVTTTASGHQVPIVAAYLPSVDNSTRAENDELKELLARQTAILEKLAEQKPAAAPAAAAAPVSGEDLFPDVPEDHWAYDFVAKLAKAGALKDCRVEDPANNPMLTRNDFAQILYTALKNGATKNPALNKDNGLNRLASEFRAELKNVKR